jgi:ATP-dependent RNA helicase DeaD
MTAAPVTAFDQLNLSAPIFKALEEVGYETPSPIQAQTIPPLLAGKDMVGQAQTGTGKTAAFALPILSNLDLKKKAPQVLVLAPTRELAIQVAEAFQTYAAHIKGFHVLPVYGGQDYRGQIRALQRGVHVIVGTPGRVMDHMKRGTLKLDGLTTLVLDEADEMLRMGFIDDVDWILSKSPEKRQIALFSATMPKQIRNIASKYLKTPVEITIKVKTATADTIRQRYWPVSGAHKLDTLTRILESEPFDAMLVFVRTKIATADLAEKLEARGYASAPLSGDIQQKQRERTVKQLKDGKLDIIVATDVAARGLDVDRISHVINYDIPYDTEAYIHRIGRTGRAGRKGDAILFVAPREKRMLAAIERATKQKITLMELPSNDVINDRRIARFKQRITDTLEAEDLKMFTRLVSDYQKEQEVPMEQVAAALAQLVQGDGQFLLTKKAKQQSEQHDGKGKKERERRPRGEDRQREGKRERAGDKKSGKSARTAQSKNLVKKHGAKTSKVEEGMQRYRIEVGHDQQVKPANIVGAIANEADLESQYIGRIDIYDQHSFVDLPEGMPKAVLKKLKKVWVSGKQLKMALIK